MIHFGNAIKLVQIITIKKITSIDHVAFTVMNTQSYFKITNSASATSADEVLNEIKSEPFKTGSCSDDLISFCNN